MTDILILLAIGVAAVVLWRKLDALERAREASAASAATHASAQFAVLGAQIHALEQQQDALTTAIRDAGQRITNFSFPPLPEPKVVTVEVPVKQGVTQQVIAAPKRKEVCLVLMDRDEKTVDGIMWVPPHKRAQTVTWEESKYTCASGSVAEGHFVYREVA